MCILVRDHTLGYDISTHCAGPPSSVARRVINSTAVELSWRAEQYLPPAVTIQRYSIRVLNTSDPRSPQILQTSTEEGAPDENGILSHVFNFERELSPCTQITFSVTSTSSVGTSPPSNVTWERLRDGLWLLLQFCYSV